ncbi:unnamed protein product [Closterium sp. NIES-64]|nr:unnamed protein product [Closterium sp. NIES-64]
MMLYRLTLVTVARIPHPPTLLFQQQHRNDDGNGRRLGCGQGAALFAVSASASVSPPFVARSSSASSSSSSVFEAASQVARPLAQRGKAVGESALHCSWCASGAAVPVVPLCQWSRCVNGPAVPVVPLCQWSRCVSGPAVPVVPLCQWSRCAKGATVSVVFTSTSFSRM